MGPNLPSALDNLAANGIINFDADAYIHGKPARYVGEPKAYLPFDQPLNCYQGAALPGQPAHDAFVKEGEASEHKPADWKKAATAVLLGGIAVLGGLKYGPKIAGMFKKAPAAPTVAPPPVAPPVAPQATNAATGSKVKNFFNKIGSKIKNLPTWVKITGGIAIGLVALAETAKAALIHKMKKAQAAQLAQQGPQTATIEPQPAAETQPAAQAPEVQPEAQAPEIKPAA